MRGLRNAAVAAALAAAAFLAARGCGEAEDPASRRTEARTDVPGATTAGVAPESSSEHRPRAARPAAESPAVAATSSARPLKLVVLVQASPEGTPIEGATVLLPELAGRPTAVTDAGGRAALDVPAGQHVVHVSSAGRTTTPTHVVCRERITAHHVALPAGARLEGRVAEAGTGRHLAGVKVALHDGGWVEGTWWGMSGKSFAELVSDEAGAFGIDGLATGRALTIESTLSGRARNRTTLLVAATGVLRAEIAMEPGGCVTGFVRRGDGTPLPGVVVSVGAAVSSGDRIPGHAPLSARTGADGVYRVEGLDLDGVYVVECYASPSASATATGVRPTAAAPEVRCDLTFAPTGVLRVELTGTRAAEEDSVHVFTLLPGMHDVEFGWLSDGERRELTPRRLRVDWNPEDGHPAVVREVEIESGAETVVRIERPPVHRVVGRVVEADGRPVADADVSLTRLVGDESEAPDLTLHEDGTFELAHVAAGPWILEADFPGRPGVRREIVVPCEPLIVAAPAETSLRFRLPGGLDGALVRWAVESKVVDADGRTHWKLWSSGVELAGEEPLVHGPPGWTGLTRLRADVPGFRVFERIVDVVSGSHHDVVAGPLVPCESLHGRVTDRRGRPVAGAAVSIEGREPTDDVRRVVETDADGLFANLRLPDKATTVRAEASGYAIGLRSLPVSPAEPVEIVLSRPGRLLVRARDGNDAPAVGREVRVVDGAGRTVDLSPTAHTDHRGRAEFRVPPGRLCVTVGDADPVEVEVAEDATVAVVVVVGAR